MLLYKNPTNHIYTLIYASAHTLTHTHTRTYTQTHTRARMRAHTHTQNPLSLSLLSPFLNNSMPQDCFFIAQGRGMARSGRSAYMPIAG